jgi:hypothetical protein
MNTAPRCEVNVIDDENLLIELELMRTEAQMLYDILPAGPPKQRVGYTIAAYTLAQEVLTGRQARRKNNLTHAQRRCVPAEM